MSRFMIALYSSLVRPVAACRVFLVVFDACSRCRSSAGALMNAYTGVALQGVSMSVGARGAVTMDSSFVYERRYNGTEWAALAGA